MALGSLSTRLVLALRLCTLATYYYYSLGFVRLLFVPPVRFSWYYVLWSCIYICWRRSIEEKPEIQWVFPQKSSVFFDAKIGWHFSGEILGHTDAGQGDSNRAGNGGKIDFPFLSSAIPHPSLQVLIRQGAPTSSTDLSHKFHHSYFLCIQSSFQALSLPKPFQPLEAILLTTINSQICRVLNSYTMFLNLKFSLIPVLQCATHRSWALITSIARTLLFLFIPSCFYMLPITRQTQLHSHQFPLSLFCIPISNPSQVLQDAWG